jgi:hypothetical protein
MRQVEKWLWRIRWGGRWTTTRSHRTEEEIRVEHPEATKIEASRVVVDLPATEAEAIARQSQRGRR